MRSALADFLKSCAGVEEQERSAEAVMSCESSAMAKAGIGWSESRGGRTRCLTPPCDLLARGAPWCARRPEVSAAEAELQSCSRAVAETFSDIRCDETVALDTTSGEGAAGRRVARVPPMFA